MKIAFKLLAPLTDYLPAAVKYTHMLEMDVASDASISQIIGPMALPEKMVYLVLVNGSYVEPAGRMTRRLVEGDVLAIWPPIAGG